MVSPSCQLLHCHNVWEYDNNIYGVLLHSTPCNLHYILVMHGLSISHAFEY